MSSEQLNQTQNADTAIKIIDKILPHLPDYGVFHFAYYAKDVLNWTEKEVREIAIHEHHIVHIALNQLHYVSEKTKGYYFELTDKGREAKSKGGHKAYLEFLEKNKKLDAERVTRKDKSEKLDLVLKQWQVRTRLLPYFLSIFAIFFLCCHILKRVINYETNVRIMLF